MILAYEELVDFIAGGSTPQEVANFQPSEAAQARASELLQRNRSEELTKEEKEELKQFMDLEHIMRLAKAKARLRLAKK